jgi:hypothetical protein
MIPADILILIRAQGVVLMDGAHIEAEHQLGPRVHIVPNRSDVLKADRDVSDKWRVLVSCNP